MLSHSSSVQRTGGQGAVGVHDRSDLPVTRTLKAGCVCHRWDLYGGLRLIGALAYLSVDH